MSEGLNEAPLKPRRVIYLMKKSHIHAVAELQQGFKPFLESWGLNFLSQGFGLLCKSQIYSLLSMVLLRGP